MRLFSKYEHHCSTKQSSVDTAWTKNMKFLIALTIFGAVAADVSHLSNHYLTPVESSAQSGYLPPVSAPPQPLGYIPPAPQTQGYIPPAVSAPVPTYIPPAPVGSAYIPPAPQAPGYIPPALQTPGYIPPAEPVSAYIPPATSAPEYIPPQETSQYLPPAEPAPVYEANNDGYKYRTVKRIKYRHRA